MAVDTTVYIFGYEGTDDNFPYHPRIWSFDTEGNGGLGTWGAAPETDEFPDRPIADHDSYDWRRGYVVRYENGDFGVIYKEHHASGSTRGPLLYRLWDGSWNAPIELRPGTTPLPGTMVYDPSTELMYLLYHPFRASTSELRLLTIDHGGAAVSADLYSFPDAASAFTAYTGLIHDGVLMFSWVDQTNDATPPIWEWDIDGGGSFTKKLLPLPDGELDSPTMAALYFGNNGLPVALNTYDVDILYLAERGSDGAWGESAVLYDNTVDAPPFFEMNVPGAGARYLSQGDTLGIMCRKKTSPSDADGELFFLGNGDLRVNITDQIAYAITGAPLPGGNDHSASGAQYINGAYWFFGVGWDSGSSRDIAAIRSGDGGATWTLQDAANAPSLGKWGWLRDTFVGEGESEEEEEGVGMEFGDENPGPGECAIVTRSDTADVESEEEPREPEGT